MKLSSITLVAVAALLGACTAPASRQWLDTQTGLTVSAQAEPLVLAREDFPAGVNVRDYAELGVFDVNRSGEHRRYMSLVLWSTVDRSAQELATHDEAFAQVTVWADDQPLLLKRAAITAESLLLSAPVFRLPSPNARQAYYPITAMQLKALADAQQLIVTPAMTAQGERSYTLWRGKLQSLRAFVAELPN